MMKLKPLKISLLVSASFILTSLTSHANTSSFKVAVVENSGFNNEIANHEYSKIINKLTKKYIVKMSLEEQMQLCVAYLKSIN